MALLLLMAGCASVGKNAATNDAEASRAGAARAFHEEGSDVLEPHFTTGKSLPKQNQQIVSGAQVPGSRVTVEIDTFFVYGFETSPQEAREKSLARTRELALQKALPVDVSISTMVTDIYVEINDKFDEHMAKSIFMLTSSAGRFENETLVRSKTTVGSDFMRCEISYKADIIQLPRAYNSEYNLKVELSETLLRDGERFWVHATANRDGYLYVFNVLADNSVALVFPSRLFPDNRVWAQEPWSQRLGAATLPDRDHSIETLYFIYSAREITGWEDFSINSEDGFIDPADDQSFIKFQRWLGRGDPGLRVEKLAQLHIFK
ncbi:MAG: DUF4384 domain-containing protein [Candidatus Cloacimonadaceae bacterium]|jgi:hypothetical protein|nr:DUF4384 domain-containing protein [Candidatus Cloacimonadota bacterium]MDX9950293.1 DUF4384 domain-containing protein [Candidatus Syntrophosphaera sp.]